MNEKSEIVILVTGCTFDKEYNEITGKLYFNDSHIKEMLKLGRCKIKVGIKNTCASFYIAGPKCVRNLLDDINTYLK